MLKLLHRVYLHHIEILLELVVAAETVTAPLYLIVFALTHELIYPLLDIVVTADAEIVEDMNDLAGLHVGNRDGAIL